MNQSELNKEMVSHGIARYRRRVQTAKERRQESDSPYGQRLLRNYLPLFIDAVEKRFDYHRKHPHAVPVWMPLVWDMDTRKLCLLAFKCVLDGISERRPLTSASIRIATAIEDEIRYQRLKEEYPKVFYYAQKDVEKNKNASYRRQREAFLAHERGEAKKGHIEAWRQWTRREKTMMGTWLLELIRANTHLIAFKLIGIRKQSVFHVTATDELFEWMAEYNKDQEILKPLWLPTVELPEQWSSIWVGGYNDIEGVPPLSFIKCHDYKYMNSLDFDAMKPVVDGVNHLQATKWEVNEDILGIAKWAWQNNKEIGEMIRREDYELPVWKPEYDDDEDGAKEFSRKCGSIHRLNIAMRSKRLMIMKTLWTAERFEDKTIYFPHHLDFRGRMYPIPYFLSPQGTDLSKGLLRFATSQTINNDADARWLAIHGANCFGHNKLTFDERVEWVNSRRKEIEEVHQDPQVNDWWQAAEEPWQFLAFCREWSRYLEQGYGFETKLPCAMDASNNGIQILSLLGRDEIGGRATNVVATEQPADLYTYVSDRVNELLKMHMEKGNHVAAAWLKFGIDRKTTKQPVMVKPYGGTQYSCRELISDWYRDKCMAHSLDPFGYEATEAIGYLNKLVWQAMNDCMKRPTEVMKWLQQTVRILGKEDKPITWTTPSGFKIKQNYINNKTVRIQTLLGDKISWIKCREPQLGVDKTRQANGISPNFVHSLDASVAQQTATKAKAAGIEALAMVHDSFATHSTHCDKLSQLTRETTADIFSTDQLAKFRDEISTQTEKELPELPTYGKLDPTDVLDSQYFFA